MPKLRAKGDPCRTLAQGALGSALAVSHKERRCPALVYPIAESIAQRPRPIVAN